MRSLRIIVMLACILGANFYVCLRILQLAPFNRACKILIAFCIVVLILCMALPVLLDDKIPMPAASLMYKAGTSWFFIFVYLLIIFLVLDLTKLFLPLEKYMHSSRIGFAVLASFLLVVFTLGNIKYHNKKRVGLPLVIDKELAGPLKIVAVSDLHLGYGIGPRELAKWTGMINREDADIVLIAGDAIDNSLRPLEKLGMAGQFKQIKSKYGIYAVFGNHEYIAGEQGSRKFFEEAGINLLKDGAALVDGRFYIVGRDDRTNPARKPLSELVSGLDRSKPIIALDHQPYRLEEAEQNGIDLQLSGHTHRGQVWPISLITDILYENSHGYLKKGGAHVYVSSGLGIWGGKYRIGTQSEYVVIELASDGEHLLTF